MNLKKAFLNTTRMAILLEPLHKPKNYQAPTKRMDYLALMARRKQSQRKKKQKRRNSTRHVSLN